MKNEQMQRLKILSDFRIRESGGRILEFMFSRGTLAPSLPTTLDTPLLYNTQSLPSTLRRPSVDHSKPLSCYSSLGPIHRWYIHRLDLHRNLKCLYSSWPMAPELQLVRK